MDIQPFKNRAVSTQHPIELYRCLNRKGYTFSIRQFGKVVGHTESITIYNCSFIVGNGGKKRSIREMTRNVHAYIKGYLIGTSDIDLNKSRLIYNPYVKRGFHCEGTDVDLTESKMVELNSNGIFTYIDK